MSDESCRYCGAAIREVAVVVGDAPGREVMLRISVEPDDDGRVIMRRDGSFRLLGHVHYRGRNIAGWRVHGSSMDECRTNGEANGHEDNRSLT